MIYQLDEPHPDSEVLLPATLQLHYIPLLQATLHTVLQKSQSEPALYSLPHILLAFTVHMDAPPSVTAVKRKQFCRAVALQTRGGGCVRHGVCVLCVRRGVRQGVELVMLSQRCV